MGKVWSRQRNLRFRIVCNLPKVTRPVRDSRLGLQLKPELHKGLRNRGKKSKPEIRSGI